MKIAHRTIVFVCLTAVCQSGIAADLANNSMETDEQIYFEELPIILSASLLAQHVSEAPNAITVIDRKMITASGFRTISDLFKLVPGMYVSYYKGSQAIVSYHGTTDQYARRMQVMIDGRSIYLPPVSTIDWANLPITLEDIERIEIIRGPAAASHGANSMLGVISIITRDAGSLDGKNVKITRGNGGINDVALRFGSIGEAFDYRMTLAYTADNGYENLSVPPHNIPLTQPGAPTLLNNNYDSNGARLMNFRGSYHPNGADSFDIQFGLNHDVQGVGFVDKNPSPTNPNSTNGNMPHDLFSESGFAQLGWIHQLGEESEINMRFYHIQQNRSEAFPVYIGGTYYPGPVTQSIKTTRNEISAQHTLRTTETNRLVYGSAFRQDKIEGVSDITPLALKFSTSEKMNEWRIFAHDEWTVHSKLLLNMGGLLENDRMDHQNFSPRFVLNFHATPEHTFRIGTSIAYRTPALVEEKFPAIQPGDLIIPGAATLSPNLKPERIESRAIGYLGEYRQWGTSLDLRVYRDFVSNVIYVDKVKNVFTNGLDVEYRGFEATLKYSPSDRSDFILNYARAWAKSNSTSLAPNLVSNDPANNDIVSASLPRNSASMLYAQRRESGFSWSVGYYFQDAMQSFDRGYIDHQFSQRRMDIRIAQSFREVLGCKGEVALVVQNLFNHDNTEYVANNVLDRRGYATLSLDW